MTVTAVSRALEGRVGKAAAWRAWTTGGKEKGRDKSACHECLKPLTGLAFSRARRLVVCRFPGFSLRFQCSGMHRGISGLGWGCA